MDHEPTRPPADGWDDILADLRAGTDRRSDGRRVSQRRSVDLGAERDRRRGSERRGRADRRTRSERRIPSDDQFTWMETQRIHVMLAGNGDVRACPRCEGQLLIGPEEIHDRIATREVICTGCRYGTVVTL